MVEELARMTGNLDMVRVHVDDQMDSKSLLGAYVCTSNPEEFVWQPGPLTQVGPCTSHPRVSNIISVEFTGLAAGQTSHQDTAGRCIATSMCLSADTCDYRRVTCSHSSSSTLTSSNRASAGPDTCLHAYAAASDVLHRCCHLQLGLKVEHHKATWWSMTHTP